MKLGAGKIGRLFALGLLGTLATAGLGAAAASAQQAPGAPRVQTPAAAASTVRLRGDRRAGEVFVPIDKSQILEVDQPYAEVTVGNPDVADVVPLSATAVYVFGKRLGSTTLTLTASGGRTIAVVDLVVTFDVESLKARLFELVPGTTVEVRPANDGLVLSGRVPTAAQLQRILAVAQRYAGDRVTNLIEVIGTQQVMLAVRFAEVQRSVIKQLGLASLVYDGSDKFKGFAGQGINPESFASAFVHIGDLDLLFEALEDKGVVKTLAEPNLIALSGGTARFLAGGEFPIPVGQDTNNNNGVDITIEFKEFGVGLSFTPTVLSSELINLVLSTEVSEIDERNSIVLDNLVIPGLKVRRANTTVELGNGQSFAIAGLLQQDFEDAIRQFPFLGDLPVLGALFRSSRYQTGQTELVVVVTPYLVRPSVESALATPADNFIPPSQADFFLFGRTEGRGAPGDVGKTLEQQGAGGIAGPYGYILQ
jgi:pilus assembly protein CpaC